MNKFIKIAISFVGISLLAACGFTSGSLSDDPGYANLKTPHFWEADKEIGLSLGPTILNFAGSFIEEDNEAAGLIKNLKGIKLRVYNVENNGDMFSGYLSETTTKLNNQGWEQLVSVNEENEKVSILIKAEEETINGVVVIVLDQQEAVFVNLIGNIDPDAIQPIVSGIYKDAPNFSADVSHEI